MRKGCHWRTRGVVFTVAAFAVAMLCAEDAAAKRINSGEVEINITVDAPADSGKTRLWVPYPVSGEHQTIENVRIEGNHHTQSVMAAKETGAMALYVEWNGPVEGQKYVNLSFHASAGERKSGLISSNEPGIPRHIKKYLRSSELIPTGGKIKQVAMEAVKGKRTVAGKHEAIYGWVVENMKRDPNVQGCGLGVVERVLAHRGGKCADISTVYVALARAAGVPSREVFGLRLGKKEGEQDMTSGHHCWAEYYQPGYGWVQTDPADVRKLMLVNGLTLDQAGDIRKYYLKNVGPNRIALGHGGRGVWLNPRQDDGPLNYFMYPYAEVDGKRLPWLAAQEELKYRITFTKD